MVKLCSFHPTEAHLAPMYQRILAVEGIASSLRNDRLVAALGEIPFVECYTELWILEDDLLLRAREVLAAYETAAQQTLPPWTCPRCGEKIDDGFGACWNCDCPHPESMEENKSEEAS